MYGSCILVDDRNASLKIVDAVDAHTRPAKLHRAFSVFLFNDNGDLLMQQRSKHKKTYPLAFSNTVCSHQRDDEKSDIYYCKNRLINETGIDVAETDFKYVMTIKYSAVANLSFGEYEIDRLFIVVKNLDVSKLKINPDEVEQIIFMSSEQINEMLQNDKIFVTPWFRSIWKYFKQSNHSNKTFYQNLLNYPSTTIDNEIIINFDKVDMPCGRIEDDNIILAPYSYVASMKGKDVRGSLIKAIGKICNADQSLIDFVTNIVDGVHQASLIMDDIEDKSKLRRGLETAHISYGEPLTINAGVFALIKLTEQVNNRHPKMLGVFLKAISNLHRGQGAEIYWNQFKYIPTIEQLKQIMMAKTGALFKLGYEMLENDLSVSHVKLLMFDWIDLFGVHFQIKDDLINLTDEEYWKSKGFCDDFDEQKYSFPIVIFYEKCSDILKKNLFTILFHKNEKTHQDKQDLLNYLHSENVFDDVKNHILQYENKMRNILKTLQYILTPEQFELFKLINKKLLDK